MFDIIAGVCVLGGWTFDPIQVIGGAVGGDLFFCLLGRVDQSRRM